jgi:hypothetical protein
LSERAAAARTTPNLRLVYAVLTERFTRCDGPEQEPSRGKKDLLVLVFYVVYDVVYATML